MQTRPLFSGRMSPQATTFTPPIASLNLSPLFTPLSVVSCPLLLLPPLLLTILLFYVFFLLLLLPFLSASPVFPSCLEPFMILVVH